MPISRYPRPGHPLVPRLLSPFLNPEPILRAAGLLDSRVELEDALDDRVWKLCDFERCRRLGEAVVAETANQVSRILNDLGSKTVGPRELRLKIKELQLQQRTFNCLTNINVDSRPGGVTSLTIAEALAIRSFGVKCLVDLMTAIDACTPRNGSGVLAQKTLLFDTTEPLLDAPSTGNLQPTSSPAKPSRIVVPRNLRERLQRKEAVPYLTMHLPALPTKANLSDLGLPNRVYNALAKAGFDKDLHRLSSATLGEILEEAPHFGLDCLFRLIEAAYGFVSPMHRRRRSRETADEEALRFLVPSGDKRRREIAISYFGLLGQQPHTLEEVGQQFDISRERVRQLITPSFRRDEPLPPSCPKLEAAIRMTFQRCPCDAAVIESDLVSAGLIQEGTTLDGLLKAADVVGKPTKLLIERRGTTRFVFKAKQLRFAQRLRSFALKCVSRIGATTFSEIESRLSARTSRALPIELLQFVVQTENGFRWLDDEQNWFWIDNKRRNKLRRRIYKVLAVAPKISATELRAAIRRDYRMSGLIPPAEVIIRFCEQIPACRVESNLVIATEDHNIDIGSGSRRVESNLVIATEDHSKCLSASEAKFASILKTHGPLCARPRLQELALESGISFPSFWQMMSFSPIVTRYARSVYGLAGAQILPGQAESLVPPPVSTTRLQDHGWTSSGSIWIAYQLSQNSIQVGVLGVPAGKRDLLQGEFDLTTEHGTKAGRLVVRESSVWGFAPLLRRYGAETGDILVLEFFKDRSTVVGRIGDGSLVDRFQSQ